MSTQETLRRRLDFLKLDDAAARVLESSSSDIVSHLPESLDAFYAQLRNFPEVRRFFSDERQIEGAKSAQARHWSAIAGGRFDGAYVESVERIGAMHAKIGLEPRWYIGGYALILENLLVRLLKDEESAKGGLFGGGKKRPPRDKARLASLVVKAAMLDMDIVISTYLEAAEKQRLAIEAEQTKVVDALRAGLAALAAGDLTVDMSIDVQPQYQQLKDDYNGAIAKLREAMGAIATSADSIHTGSGEITQAANDLSGRTEQQAAALEETAAALEEITATIKKSAESATQVNQVVTGARHDAEKSGEVVREAVTAMDHIEQSSKQIGQIIGVIDEIAFQTNLLALNAGVEAARAGDAGKGFAVVAQEVRALAQRSAEAAKEIKTLISASSQQVGQGVTLVRQTGEALERIVVKVAEISGLVAEITASAQEQASGVTEVNSAVTQMDQVTQQNAAMVEQSTAASHALSQEADDLVRLVSRFETGGGARAAAAPPLRSAPPATQAVRRSADFRSRFTAPALKQTSQVRAAPSAQDEGWEEF